MEAVLFVTLLGNIGLGLIQHFETFVVVQTSDRPVFVLHNHPCRRFKLGNEFIPLLTSGCNCFFLRSSFLTLFCSISTPLLCSCQWFFLRLSAICSGRCGTGRSNTARIIIEFDCFGVGMAGGLVSKMDNAILICVTEKRSKQDIGMLAEALEAVL